MSGGSVRRLPVVVVLVVAALVAFAVGDRDAESVPASDAAPDAAAVPPAGTRSSAWFCAGAPTPIPPDRESISIANTGDDGTEVVLTVLPDDGSDAVSQTLEIGARSVNTLPRNTLGAPGGVVVESFSRAIAVESGIEAADQLALNPCASVTSTDWYFSAGTTVRGAAQWLVLFNPLGTDAKVDVAFGSDVGGKESSALIGLDVPRRSRVIRSINESVQNQPRVSIEIHARVGRVVAEQTMLLDDRSGAPGTTRSLGVPAPAPKWDFPYGHVAPGSATQVAVSNPGDIDSEVDVLVVPTNEETVVDVITVPVAAGEVIWVQVGGCGEAPPENCVVVPDETTYAVQVESDADKPVVAELFVRRADPTIATGGATTPGTSTGATRWVFPRSRVADEHLGVLALEHSGDVPVQASVAIVHDGQVEELPELQNVAVAPSRPTIITLSELSGVDGALVVTATGPIAAQRVLFGAGDQTATVGIPQR